MQPIAYDQLVQKVRDISNAFWIASLLDWDQETYMPPRAATVRGDQLAFIVGIHHERLTSDELAGLLESCEKAGVDRNGDPTAATNVRETRRLHDRARKLPRALVEEIARVTTVAKNVWSEAKAANEFKRFAPHLEQIVELKRQVAEHVGYKDDIYDALLDEYEPGARTAEVQRVFEAVRRELVPLVKAIASAPRKPNTALLEREAPTANQREFNQWLAAAIGFDFDAGRIDVSAHPFCTGMSPADVRLTNRYDEHYLPKSIFGILHETGHGLYEQGLVAKNAGTPAASSVSLGIHESQSRMWENLVGRSRAFWQFAHPRLLQSFPALAGVSLDDWHFAINTVRPSLIRVEADEVTYNLHIMVRFDLERRLLSGKLAIRDVPAAWNAAYKDMLGIEPPTDREGCLQDIHWSCGILGYFPTYALGNLYAVQFFEAAKKALGDVNAMFARGEFKPLLDWLRTNIHHHGMRYRPGELVQHVTGQALSPAPYVEYLRAKFRPLYGL